LPRSNSTPQRYEAGHRPSKRILRNLYLLDEEIEIVAAIYAQQRKALEAYGYITSPTSFAITNRERLHAWNTLEVGLGGKAVDNELPAILDDISDLRKQLAKTTQVLRYNIEIQEEGDSKAILVFTLVTIIFLPLSFVASVFGMNTVDIRDMDSSQWIFWATALPVTATIGGVSLLLAYYGTQMRDSLHESGRSVQRSLAGGIKRPRKDKLSDEEKVDPERAVHPSQRRKQGLTIGMSRPRGERRVRNMRPRSPGEFEERERAVRRRSSFAGEAGGGRERRRENTGDMR
jgi:hypothetical protein